MRRSDGAETSLSELYGVSVRRIGFAGFIGALAAIALLPLPDFWIIQLNYIGIYILPVLGLVLLTGSGGLISFGQASFVGIGAYATAYLTVGLGYSPWVTAILGLLITGSAAAFIGLITLRMSGHYLPLATLAWALSLYYLMGNIDALGKYDGILGIPGLSVLGIELGQQRGLFALIWGTVLIAIIGMTRLLDSRVGRGMRALASGASMPEAMGVNTFLLKIGMFVFSALLSAMAGWLFAHFQQAVNPSPFGIKMGIEYLFMAVLGGVSHVWGAVVGATIVKIFEEQLNVLVPALTGVSGSYELVVFGVMLVLILKYMPDGIWAQIDKYVPRTARSRDWQQVSALNARMKPESGVRVLECRDLRKTFGGLVAVSEVNFSARTGEILGLIGPNGAGKSTTFNLISGALGTSDGRISFLDAEIQGLAPREIAKRGMARTFQHVKLVPGMTVLENVALGAHTRGRRGVLSAMLRLDRTEERQLFREAERQLRRVGMGDHLDAMAEALPMGYQRLLEIARALCADPILLLLDEPAAGLRHHEKQALAHVLRGLRAEGLAILLVEHDMSLVMDTCDRIVVMEFGAKIMEGSPEEVQRSERVRSAYLGEEHVEA